MRLLKTAAVLSTCCLILSGCAEKVAVKALPIPPERTDCVPSTDRPELPPEYKIDWSKVATVGQARAAHDNFVNVLRGREKIVGEYILKVESDLFQCANDAAWLREWQRETVK